MNKICTIKIEKGFEAKVNEDGSITIEKKDVFVPKEGDIIFISADEPYSSSIIAIHKDLKCDGKFIEYFTNYSILNCGLTFFCTERRYYADNRIVRLATEEEKKILLDKMEAYGFIWNQENKTITEKYIPKDGDYIYMETDHCNCLGIYKSKEILYNVSYILGYCFFTLNTDCFSYKIVKIYSEYVKSIRPATPTEIEQLNKEIDKENLVWKPDLKRMCKKPEIDKLCIFWQNGKIKNHLIDLFKGEFPPTPIYKCTNGTWDNCILYDEEIYKEMIGE